MAVHISIEQGKHSKSVKLPWHHNIKQSVCIFVISFSKALWWGDISCFGFWTIFLCPFVLFSFVSCFFCFFCLFRIYVFLSFFLDITLIRSLNGLKSQKSIFVSKFWSGGQSVSHWRPRVGIELPGQLKSDNARSPNKISPRLIVPVCQPIQRQIGWWKALECFLVITVTIPMYTSFKHQTWEQKVHIKL